MRTLVFLVEDVAWWIGIAVLASLLALALFALFGDPFADCDNTTNERTTRSWRD